MSEDLVPDIAAVYLATILMAEWHGAWRAVRAMAATAARCM
jgi:hypothetical protein